MGVLSPEIWLEFQEMRLHSAHKVGPYDSYKWSEMTLINGRKCMGNWGYPLVN